MTDAAPDKEKRKHIALLYGLVLGLPATLLVLIWLGNQVPRPQYIRSMDDIPNTEDCFRNFPAEGEVWVLADPRTGGRTGFVAGVSSLNAITEFIRINELNYDSSGDEMFGDLRNITHYDVPDIKFVAGDPSFSGSLKGCKTSIAGAFSREGNHFVLRWNGQ